MKRLRFFAILLAFGVLFSACGSSPENAESPDVVSWIFKNSIGYGYKKSLLNDFAADVLEFNMAEIESLDPASLEEACMAYFCDNGGKRLGLFFDGGYESAEGMTEALLIGFRWMGRELLHCYSDNYGHYFQFSGPDGEFTFYDVGEMSLNELCVREDGSWTLVPLNKGKREYENIFRQIDWFQQDPEKAKSIIGNLVDSFVEYVTDVAMEEVRVLSWDFNNAAMADNYTGYFVEYEIGTGYYVLLSLTEFDNGRYEIEILYQGESIRELQDCYE